MNILKAFGRGVRVLIAATAALAFVSVQIGLADYTATQGAGLTFASLAISAKHYAAMLICDATAGESQCAAVNGSGQVAIQAPPSLPLPTGAATAANQTATERWIAGAGVGLTWTAIFGTEINSIVNGNAIASSIVVTNGTALDVYMDVSAALGSITSAAGAPYLGLYLCPLNQDGTTYCDGRFASSAAGPPLSQYFMCAIPLIPSVTQAQEGACTGNIIPPGSFKLVAYNQAGATIAASANTIAYRTYDRSVH